MGNDKKDNELLEEIVSENNPFAQDDLVSNEQQAESIENETQENEVLLLKSELEKINNQYLRLAADFDNYRKRQAQEREALLKYGAQECMKKVIELVDIIYTHRLTEIYQKSLYK